VSCRIISIEEFDKIIPVTPPNENRKINPVFHSIRLFHLVFLPYIVVIQEKILIPVGIAIIIVAAVK
jgi:hypothetical protein